MNTDQTYNTNAAILLLEDGVFFVGRFFGAAQKSKGEVIFNTGMAGYQEVFSDPSYEGQILVMTYPHIGNYGINPEDFESGKAYLEGIVVSESNRMYSNWRATESLDAFLQKNGITGIEGVDTQALVMHLRDHGAMRGIIAPANEDKILLLNEIKAFPKMEGSDFVKVVTVKEPYEFISKRYPHVPQLRTVVMFDFGLKNNTPELLAARGCKVMVVPADYPAEEVLKFDPDGIMLSNGPGDPYVVTYAVETVKKLLEKKIPTFGICMGHQLLGVALGGKTYKLPFGHHGVNHPVKNLKTGKVEITSQNHGFCIAPGSLPSDVEATHINLNDQTNEGLAHKTLPFFSVQYHPEAYPGPQDSTYLFDQFIALMEKNKH
ncbi:MAG: glutamine-hydrolyzing carbamoyl-phosphate synthase small subunit [bacterium]